MLRGHKIVSPKWKEVESSRWRGIESLKAIASEGGYDSNWLAACSDYTEVEVEDRELDVHDTDRAERMIRKMELEEGK